MVGWEHQCAGCQTRHLGQFWFYREGEADTLHVFEWLCGGKYDELSIQEKARWSSYLK